MQYNSNIVKIDFYDIIKYIKFWYKNNLIKGCMYDSNRNKTRDK